MSLTGDPDGPPTKSGLSLVDLSGGYVSAIALLSGLWRARRDGVGCDCDISLYETALHELMYLGTWAASAGYVPQRIAGLGAPVDRAVPGVPDRRRLDHGRVRQAEVLGAPVRGAAARGPLDDPRFVDFAARDRNREELLPALRDDVRIANDRRMAGDAVRAGVPAGPVYEVGRSTADTGGRPRGRGRDRAPAARDVRQIASPLRLSGEPNAARAAVPPRRAHRRAAPRTVRLLRARRSPRCGRRGRSESPARSRLDSRAGAWRQGWT